MVEASETSQGRGGLAAATGTLLGGGLLAGVAVAISLAIEPPECVFDPLDAPEHCRNLHDYYLWWMGAGYAGGVVGCCLALAIRRYRFIGTTGILLALLLPFAAFAAGLVTLVVTEALASGVVSIWETNRFVGVAFLMMSLFGGGTALLARSLAAWANGARFSRSPSGSSSRT